MKYFYFIFLLTNSIQAQSHSEILVNNTWRLVSFNNECFAFTPENPTEYDPNQIFLNFSQEGESIIYHTQICKTIDGLIQLTETEIEFLIAVTEGEGCQEPTSQQYEIGYECAVSALYSYTIIEENGFYVLEMNNDIFMGAIFTTEALNTTEVDYDQISFYPNPVKDKLTLENPDLKINQVKITNANGKLLLLQKVNSTKTEIDFSSFPKGVYILTAESKGKIIKAEKIIKN